MAFFKEPINHSNRNLIIRILNLYHFDLNPKTLLENVLNQRYRDITV